MDILFDSHVAVWWVQDPSRLAVPCREAIEDASNGVWFSAASAWELAIKVRSGKLRVDVDRLVSRLRENGVSLLGIGIDHAIAAGELDWTHRDPFDRMLVAQARRQRMLLATRDQAIAEHLGTSALAA
jgi:PIN domain nuclease of toxin-antitoxin system